MLHYNQDKTMKSKKLLIALAGCAAFVATACHGDLDIIQDNQLTASNMWTESSDVTTSAYGIYYLMRANFVQDKVNVFYWGEARVGEYMWGAGSWRTGHDNDMYGVQNSTMNDSNASTVWTKLYTAVNAANAVLKYAPTVPMSDADRQWAIGQAAFARAYLYFWAVRLWGDVPLLLNPVESVDAEECYPARSPKAYVYEQIGRDIETAVAYVTSGTDKYVATPDAVNMLKAEYALWMYATQAGGDDYLALADEALKAIGISSARLLDDYASIFAVDNKCNAEVIFALNNNQTEKLTGGYYWTFYWPATNVAPAYQMNPVPIYTTQWWNYSDNFISVLKRSKAEHNDRRVDCNYLEGPYGSSSEGVMNTISCPNKLKGDCSTNMMILDCDLLYYRYAQAVMLDAELKYWRKDYEGAVKSLNLIAKRAYGVDNFYTEATKEAVLDALCTETLLEFPCEGGVWWTLIRLDKIWDYNPSLAERRALNPNILLWPISASARNKNTKLTQTEGWN